MFSSTEKKSLRTLRHGDEKDSVKNENIWREAKIESMTTLNQTETTEMVRHVPREDITKKTE